MAKNEENNGEYEKDNQSSNAFMRQKAKKFEKSIVKLLTKC